MGLLSKLFGRKTFDDEPLERQWADVAENPVVEHGLLPEMDRFERGRGEFGGLHNPIPVNGPMGEMIYMNRLRTTSGEPFLYHRTGTAESDVCDVPLDRYELVSLKGTEWRVLYFSMYHPRRSQDVPPGLVRIRWPREKLAQIMVRSPLGVTCKVDSFPYGLPNALKEWGQNRLDPQILGGVHLAVSRFVDAMPKGLVRPDELDCL